MVALGALHFLCFLLAVAAVSYQGTDYCAMDCKEKHFACQLKNEFGSRCRPPAIVVDIKPHIDMIIDMHNHKRNNIAIGDEGYEPASRMGEIQWDEELAFLAEIKAKQCRLIEDECRTTKRFPTLGRNENYMKWWHNATYSDKEIIKARIHEWLMQSDYPEKSIAKKYEEKDTEYHVTFFARTIIESNNRVGCAAVRYNSIDDASIFLLNCFYPRDPERGQMLYHTGRSTTKCAQGTSRKYLNLCDVSEVYAYSPDALTKKAPAPSPSPRPRRPAPARRPHRRGKKGKQVPGSMFAI